MLKPKRLLTGICASAGMLILILDGKTALNGASEGIELCLKTVIPSLFPFFMLSILLTSSLSGSSLTVLRPFGRICGVPAGAESILLAGFLGGYPIGAQTVANRYHAGQLTKRDAQRMLMFCSNAGPAFLFGIAASLFSDGWMCWALWGIHIFSAALVALLIPSDPSQAVFTECKQITSPTSALTTAIRSMAVVCGWVILFRIGIAFLNRWVLWILPPVWGVIAAGILELTNGCCSLAVITNPAVRFILCSGMLAFGGLCVVMQTASVTNGLGLRYYLSGKVLQTVFSMLLAAGCVSHLLLPCCIICLITVYFFRGTQKKCCIQATAGV